MARSTTPAPRISTSSTRATSRSPNGGQGNDWALFAVFPNSETGLEPYEVQGSFLEIGTTNPPFDDRISVVGYGVDSGTANQTQQASFGPITTSSSTLLRYRADTEGGNSGSGVVWEATGEAVAIHTHGGCTTSGGSNAGTATTHPGLQAALADFCPVGGGGGIECSDIHNFVARCGGTAPNNFLLMGVLLNDSSHNGETVTFEIDGTPQVLTVINRLARLEMLVAPGAYEIEMTDPAGCAPKATVECF